MEEGKIYISSPIDSDHIIHKDNLKHVLQYQCS